MPDESDTRLLVRTLHGYVAGTLEWLGHFPADEVNPDALAELRSGIDWIIQRLPAEQRHRLERLASGNEADEPVADDVDAALLKVMVGLVVDVTWWLDATSDEEIDPDVAVKLLESDPLSGGLTGDQKRLLLDVIAELTAEEQNPARRNVLEAVPFWTGLVDDDLEDERVADPWVHPAAR